MSIVHGKQPDEVLDYTFDFSRWLTAGDEITSATSSVTSTEGGTVAIDNTDHDDTTATVWMSAGIDAETATVKVQIITAQGRTKDANFRLRIKEVT